MTVEECIEKGICPLCEGCGKMAVAVGNRRTNEIRMEAWPCNNCDGTGELKVDELAKD